MGYVKKEKKTHNILLAADLSFQLRCQYLKLIRIEDYGQLFFVIQGLVHAHTHTNTTSAPFDQAGKQLEAPQHSGTPKQRISESCG